MNDRVGRDDHLHVVLVKPSKYDDDGYVNHHRWGVLPSNTLSTLNALFRAAAQTMGVPIELHIFDESVGLVRPEKILKKLSVDPSRILVAIVGVQTNQFPRGSDLALRFRRAGAMVIVGGFHVSGVLATIGMTPELEALNAQGISLFAGEAEGRVQMLIADALQGSLRLRYDQAAYPDLSKEWPVPQVDSTLARSFMIPAMGTVDASRGCIFHCSFCTIINVQGRAMRWRNPEIIERHIRAEYPRLRYYFFTDDNMARNREWRNLFERLIALRREGIELSFMMQVDTAAYRLPDFADLAAAAGCSQVFVGIESLNPANLEAAQKGQNKVTRFGEMVDAWHQRGIAVHAAYIIGFPHDTPDSVRADLDTLMAQVRPDQASFFMLTPLPGSQDYLTLRKREVWMGDDFNSYDSFHAVTNHPHMTKEEWFSLYQEAWENFYSLENLTAVLRRAPHATYWNIFKNAAWYRYAVCCERQHPMITGFLRRKGRSERRPTFPRESVVRYSFRRLGDVVTLWTRLAVLVLFLEKLWRATWLESWRAHRRVARPLGTKVSSVQAHPALLAAVRWFSVATLYLHTRSWVLRRATGRLQGRVALSLRGSLRIVTRATSRCVGGITKIWLFLLNYVLEP